MKKLLGCGMGLVLIGIIGVALINSEESVDANILKGYKVGETMVVSDNEELISIGKFKDGKELIFINRENQNIDDYNQNDKGIFKYDREKNEVKLWEKAEKGYVVGLPKVFDNIGIWIETEATSKKGVYKEAKYILKYKKDGGEPVVIKRGKFEETNYSGITNIAFDGENIVYEIYESKDNKRIVESYNLKENTLTTNFEDNKWIGNITLDNGRMGFIVGENQKVLYMGKVSSKVVPFIELESKVKGSIKLHKDKIYMSTINNESGKGDINLVESLISFDVNTLKAEVIFNYKDLESFMGKEIRYLEMIIEYVDDNVVYIKPFGEEKGIIYNFKEKTFTEFENIGGDYYFDKEAFEKSYLGEG